MDTIDYVIPVRIDIVSRDKVGNEFHGSLYITWDSIIQVEEQMSDKFKTIDMTSKAIVITNLGVYYTIEDFEDFAEKWIGYKKFKAEQQKRYFLPIQ